jgi:tetratricopeptide (TPR) repeat protein
MAIGESYEKEPVGNEVHGDVSGSVVQARDVQGGIHYHITPRQLPSPSQLPPSGRLVNREHELAALESARTSCEHASVPCVVVVSGPAGIGKTTLGVHWARSLLDRYCDGQFYADLQGHSASGPRGPSQILGQFLRALDVPGEQIPEELSEREAMFRSLTSDRRIAVLLDDAISTAQVRPLLPSNSLSLTIVTSRWRLTGLLAHGARSIQVDRLDSSAAIDLLEQILGDERTTRQRGAAMDLVHLCALFPLAVCVAGARLASRPRWSITEMVDALTEEQQRLPALVAEDDLAMESSLDFSYERLPDQAQRLYRLAALYPGSTFDSQLMSTALAIPSPDARQLLGILADSHLIEDTPNGHYRFHDLIRLHAKRCAERNESDETRAVVSRRMIRYLLAMAAAAERRLTPDHQTLPREIGDMKEMAFSSDSRALQWLDDERVNLMSALQWAGINGLPSIAWQLADSMWPLFRLRKYYDDWIAAYDIGLEAARTCGDVAAESRMLTSGGLGLMGVGRLGSAKERFANALAINRRMGDVRAEGGALTYLGIVSRRDNRLEEAERYFSQALGSCLSAHHWRGAGLARLNLGETALAAAKPDDAISYLRQAHEDLNEIGDKYDAARALAFLGRAHQMTGELDSAQAHLGDALVVFEEVGSTYEQVYALQSLGEIARATGNPDTARSLWIRALSLYEQQPIPPTRAEKIRVQLDSL